MNGTQAVASPEAILDRSAVPIFSGGTEIAAALRTLLLSGVMLAIGLPEVSAEFIGTNIDFQDVSLLPESFYNGADGAGGFTSRGAFFNNSFAIFDGFVVWEGWSYSNMTDVTTAGLINGMLTDSQYSAYHLPVPGGGGDGSSNYAVAFTFTPGIARIELPAGMRPVSMRVTNNTYAALAMRDGNQFAKKFGDGDWFKLTVTGLDSSDSSVGTEDFFLAEGDVIVDRWTTVDLTSLSEARSLSFGLTSSDTGTFGINTPAYFALDNLRVVPEPSAVTLAGMAVTLGLVGCYWRRPERVARSSQPNNT